MKLSSKRLWLVFVVILSLALLAVILCACNPSQADKEKAVAEYGREKAYSKSYKGAMLHLGNGTIKYYIPTSVSGDYKVISEYAIAKANTLTSKVNVYISPDASTNFSFAVENGKISGNETSNAVNFYRCIPDSGEITTSTITYSKAHLDSRNLAYKKHTALHEMGHTFGLGHIEADIMKGWTVMIAPHPNEDKYQIDDYAEFDRYNITWYYGE